MTQEQLDKINTIKKQQVILASWFDDIVKDCDHKYPNGEQSLLRIDDQYSYCEICRREL